MIDENVNNSKKQNSKLQNGVIIFWKTNQILFAVILSGIIATALFYYVFFKIGSKQRSDFFLNLVISLPILIFIFVVFIMVRKSCISFNKWFSTLLLFLLLLITSYVGLHVLLDQQQHMHKFGRSSKYGFGYEYMTINTTQLQEINKIYRDTFYEKTINPDTLKSGIVYKANKNFSKKDTDAYQKVVMYLNNQYNDKIDTVQLNEIAKYLSFCTPIEAAGFLTSLRIRVKSYFWLTGPEVYFEVMFWCIFGVICSLLFKLGDIWKLSTTDPTNPQSQYDPTEVPSQVAKIFYAPICTLVIILGYNYIQDKNMVDISSSKGIIILSFIAGFYSQRMMAFLDRLKDVLLPNTGSADLPQDKKLIKQFFIKLKPDDEIFNKIEAVGMGSASVEINADCYKPVKADKYGSDPTFSFVINNVIPGKYTLNVSWQGKIDNQDVALIAEQQINVDVTGKTIEINVKKK